MNSNLEDQRKQIKDDQESSNNLQPIPKSHPKIRPFKENSTVQRIYRDLLDQTSKPSLKAKSQDIISYNSLDLRRKRYRKLHSTGRISTFLSEAELCRSHINSFNFQTLFRLIKNNKRLQHTTVAIKPHTLIVPTDGERFDVKLTSFQNIISASLIFDHHQNLTDKDLKRQVHRIQTLRELSSLTFHSDPRSKITNKSLRYLSNGIRGLTNLTSLSLNFRGNDKISSDSNIQHFFSKLETQRSLSKLSLIFMGCPEITSNGFSSIAAYLKKNRFLSKLVLTIFNCQGLKDESLNSMGRAFEHLDFLSVFWLNISENKNITDLGIKDLAQGFKNLKSLTSFALSSQLMSRMGDQGFCFLLNQLKNCTKLNRIIFSMRKTSIGSDSLTTLASLLKELAQLTELNLSLSCCLNLTEIGLQSLFEALNNLKNLQIFKITLNESKGLTDQNLMVLARNMKELTSLKTLEFIAESGSQITADGVKAFCIGLQDLRLVSRIDLRFPVYQKDIETEIITLLQNVDCETIEYNFNTCIHRNIRVL